MPGTKTAILLPSLIETDAVSELDARQKSALVRVVKRLDAFYQRKIVMGTAAIAAGNQVFDGASAAGWELLTDEKSQDLSTNVPNTLELKIGGPQNQAHIKVTSNGAWDQQRVGAFARYAEAVSLNTPDEVKALELVNDYSQGHLSIIADDSTGSTFHERVIAQYRDEVNAAFEIGKSTGTPAAAFEDPDLRYDFDFAFDIEVDPFESPRFAHAEDSFRRACQDLVFEVERFERTGAGSLSRYLESSVSLETGEPSRSLPTLGGTSLVG